jgi:ATP-dependent DNA ligase
MLQRGMTPFWNVTLRERLAFLEATVPAAIIVPMVSRDYLGFFQNMRERGDAEGLVLKRADSRYIGSYKQSAINPAWVRSKWRAGEAGTTAIDALAATV